MENNEDNKPTTEILANKMCGDRDVFEEWGMRIRYQRFPPKNQ